MRYNSRKCVIVAICVFGTILIVASVMKYRISSLPTDGEWPSRKKIIEMINENGGMEVLLTHREDIRTLRQKKSVYHAMHAAEAWYLVASSQWTVDDLKDSYKFVQERALIRSDICWIGRDYDETTNSLWTRHVLFEDAQWRGCYQRSSPPGGLFHHRDGIEVLDGIYLEEPVVPIFMELTNFYNSIVNEELDGITEGRTWSRLRKRKFSDEILNTIIWGE